MKKVLILTYYWPPSGGAGVQRWVKFVKYFRKFDWEPIVYIPENPHYPVIDNSFGKDIPNDIKILSHPIWEPYSFYKKFMGMKKGEAVQHGFIQEKKRSNLKSKISLWVRSNFFIPDARKFWIKPSIKYLTNYFKDAEKPDVIISTGPPHSVHLIGLGLKKNLKIAWVADFRDPWTGIDFYSQLKLTKLADNYHHKLENKVLTNADKVIAIGWHMADELKGLGAKEVEVITNGFDESDFKESIKTVKNKKFTISHIGSLNKDRNPTILWPALKEIIAKNEVFKNSFNLKLVGKVDHFVLGSIEENGLSEYLEKIDYLPHNEISNVLTSSDILLLLLNDTPNIEGIVTGKIFEYLASQRPILCIGSSTGDAARIINKTNSGKAVNFDDKSEIKTFLLSEFDSFINNKSIKTKTENIVEFSRKNLTKKLVELLNDMLV